MRRCVHAAEFVHRKDELRARLRAMDALIIFLLCLPMSAQSLPSNWVGIGAGYNGGTTPNLNVTTSFATLISKSAGTYSFTSADYSSARTRPFSVTSTLRTGIAMVIRHWSRFTLLEMFDAGAGTGSGGLVGSLGVGGVAMVNLKGGFTISADVHESKNAGSSWNLASVLQVGHAW